MRSTTIAATIVCCVTALTTACDRPLTAPPAERASDRAAVYDAVWNQIDRRYPYFEYKRINWDSLGTHYRPLALAATTDADFARTLGHLMSELRDMHVSLTPFGAGSTIRYVSPFDTVDTHFDAARTIARYLSRAAATAGDHIIYGTVAPEIAYLRIASFADDGWAGEVDRAVAAMGSARGVVIDVRGNMGGNQALAIAIAGRFADRRRTFGYLRYRNGSSHGAFTGYTREFVSPAGRRFSGPVYVLTNRRVFSSAEDFVLAMRALPNVTIVGDTTVGASGGPRAETLDNGWVFQYSQWMEYTADGLVVEGVGLAPDVIVPATAADAKVGRDAALERAIALALARLQAAP